MLIKRVFIENLVIFKTAGLLTFLSYKNIWHMILVMIQDLNEDESHCWRIIFYWHYDIPLHGILVQIWFVQSIESVDSLSMISMKMFRSGNMFNAIFMCVSQENKRNVAILWLWWTRYKRSCILLHSLQCSKSCLVRIEQRF